MDSKNLSARRSGLMSRDGRRSGGGLRPGVGADGREFVSVTVTLVKGEG